MEYISDYIKEILGFIVISGLIINVLPDNKNVKYIRLFMGLVLTLLLISPLLKLGRVDISRIMASEADVQVSAGHFEKELNEKLDNEYIRISEEYISRLAESFGVTVLKVTLDKEELSVYVEGGGAAGKSIDVGRIVLSENTQESKYKQLAQSIALNLNIQPGQVHIYETG